MRTQIMIAVAVLALGSATANQAVSAPCKDAKGKFIKCPPPAKPMHCKDAKGKFVKCPK